MSYILDALRRADAERERGAVPGLHAQPLPAGTAQAPGSRRLLWAGAAAAALLVVALAALAGWLWGGGAARQAAPGSAPESTTATATATATAPAATASTAALVPAAAPAASALAAPAAPVAPAAPDPVARADAVAPQREARSELSPATQAPASPPRRSARSRTEPGEAPEETTSRARASPSPSAAAVRSDRPGSALRADTEGEPEAAPVASRRVLSLDELPPEIRRTLPVLTVSGSIYSEDASSRFVMINGEAVREGGRITPELTLEQIRLKSAVLRYKGYRYRLPL